MLLTWLQNKGGTIDEDGLRRTFSIGRFSLRYGAEPLHQDKSVGIGNLNMKALPTETAEVAVQTDAHQESSTMKSPKAPSASHHQLQVFDQIREHHIREKNIESLRSALKTKKAKGQSFACADLQPAALAVDTDRKVFKSFN